ncbi:sensor histidine kinase [Sunxiuqinia sp. A32]|uniref:sensor histidine kinase n=1 Tax=Sunxiuqinia sp. A32 TaxID=3461496 RepID=UPI004046420D
MGRSTIRFVIVLATLSVLGIIFIQFFFLKNTVDLNEKKFHESTTQALVNVATHLVEYNNKVYGHKNTVEVDNPVEQISNNYYVVNVNDVINPSLLEHFLIKEFKTQNLKVDFEYAIYDCEGEKMVYGNYLKEEFDTITRNPIVKEQSSACDTEEAVFEQHYKQKKKVKDCNLPTCEKYTYYFGVSFPERSKYYSTQVKAWYYINGFLVIVILFFGYTISVILKQRKLSEVQKNFINNLTHEFKTPIASIDLSAKVLSDPKIAEHPKRLNDYSTIINQQTKRLSDQVEKVLQMATIEKKKLQLQKEDINLAEFVPKTISDFKTSLNGNKYQIELSGDNENIHITADPLHFSNVIFNILDNAIKYCDDSPEIEVDILKDKRHIQLRFSDNGIGIPKEFRKKIYGRFYRIPTGDIHNVKGFGLGLDYVKKIIERHGWKIQVSDNSPKGSIFTITIPR